jgi:hypothetical protein
MLLHQTAHEKGMAMSPKDPLEIIGTDRLDGERLIVEYSDKSSVIYTVEQLAGLKPVETKDGADEPGEGIPA